MSNEEAEKEYKKYLALTKLAGVESAVDKTGDGEYTLREFTGSIPEFVTRVDLDCVYEYSTFDIPSSVRDLAQHTFQFSELIECTIPETVMSLGSSIFSGSSKLESAFLKCAMPKLPDSTFRCCRELKDVELPSSITELGDGCFYECKNLRSINLPSSIRTIGKAAFQYAGLDSIELEGVHLVGSSAFSRTPNLISVTIPSTLIEYQAAFVESSLRTAEIYSEVVSPNAFAHSELLEKVVLHEGVKLIMYNAFLHCHRLREVKIPRSVEYVEWNSFRESGLECVYLHESFPEAMLDTFQDVHVEYYR